MDDIFYLRVCKILCCCGVLYHGGWNGNLFPYLFLCLYLYLFRDAWWDLDKYLGPYLVSEIVNWNGSDPKGYVAACCEMVVLEEWFCWMRNDFLKGYSLSSTVLFSDL